MITILRMASKKMAERQQQPKKDQLFLKGKVMWRVQSRSYLAVESPPTWNLLRPKNSNPTVERSLRKELFSARTYLYLPKSEL